MAETVMGIRTKIELVSFGHGRIRVPLAQSFDYTPRITEKTINEFDNLRPALLTTTFDGVDGKFDYFASDDKLVEAAIMDVDPAQSVIVEDPSAYKNVELFINSKGQTTAKIFESVLLTQLLVKGSPFTEGVKDEGKLTRDFSGVAVFRVKGGAILYTRGKATGSTAFATSEDKTFPASSPFTVTLDKSAVSLTQLGATYLLVKKNGLSTTTGFTISGTSFTLSAAPSATDVWEAFTVYLDT